MDRLYDHKLEDGCFIYYKTDTHDHGEYYGYKIINRFLHLIDRLEIDDTYMCFYAYE